jgi:uncharacterized protein YndB with AHSA1/START domain
MTNEYHFLTHWHVAGTADEVYDLISNPSDYPRWWPSVYLKTTEIDAGDERAIGRRIQYHTKGWLPYTLRWESRAVEVDRPNRLTIRASGDFNGVGIWTFQQDGAFVNVAFDWRLTADKPLLRYLSFLFKPIFSANHVWAMARGQQSLQLELARRRSQTAEEASKIPAAPSPKNTSGLWLTLGAVVTIGVLIALLRLVFR